MKCEFTGEELYANISKNEFEDDGFNYDEYEEYMMKGDKK